MVLIRCRPRQFWRTLRRAAAAGAAAVLAAFAGAPPAAASIWLQTSTVGHAAPIMRLAADAGRDLVVTASDDKTARIWALGDGRLIATLRPPVGPARTGRLFGAAVHPREDLVAVAGSGSATLPPGPSIWIYRSSSGAFERRLDARGEHVRRLRWSPDGRLLFACYAEPGAFRAFDATSGQLVHEEPFAGDCLALAVRGEQVAAGSRDGTVVVYRAGRVRSGADPASPAALAPVARFGAGGDVLSLDFSPDLRRLAIGYFTAGLGASIVAADSGEVQQRLRTPLDVLQPNEVQPVSTTQAVVWSSDGDFVITAGSADRRPRVEGRVNVFEAASGQLVRGLAVAEDTVTDLVLSPGAAPDGSASARADAVVWGSFAGTWGVVDGVTSASPVATTRSTPQIPFLIRRGASELWLSRDGMTVRWAQGAERVPVSFAVGERSLGAGDTAGLGASRHRRGFFDAAEDFENHFHPKVRGQLIALRTGEVSRALTYLGDEGDVVLATSEGLRRLNRSLQVVWEVRTPTEVRAVNASADARFVVTTLSDGTVRWWRAKDGALLLSVLVMPDGWVMWMPSGHYDASHGVESRIGWLVDRPGAAVPDFFTVGRFRDLFLRPDVIDRVLVTADVEAAVALADAARLALPGTATSGAPQAAASASAAGPTPAQPVSPASAPAATAPAAAAPPQAVDQIADKPDLPVPPVLAPLASLRLDGRSNTVTLRFSLRLPAAASSGSSPASADGIRLEARLDGRLVQPTRVRLPTRLDGREEGEVNISVDDAIRVVQLVARSGDTASEPLRFQVDRSGARPLEPAAPTGALYVVAIGIGAYPDRAMRLDLPAKDATDFVAVQQRQRGFLYREVEARVLRDSQATRSAIEDAMHWLEAQVGPGDLGMVFMAGHGFNDAAGRYYFVPYDYDPARPLATSVPGRSFSDALARLRGRPLLFLDACYAGAVTQRWGQRSVQTARLTNALAAPENSVVVFAASTGQQESLESLEWGNGAFTKLLVQGLGGAARLPSIAAVTTRSLSPFVRQGVIKLTQGRQTPVAVIPDVVPERILATAGAGTP